MSSIRYQQRFEFFEKSLILLKSACRKKKLSELERAGLIQTFEFCFELAWKLLKDKLEDEGMIAKSPKETIKASAEVGYISNGKKWLGALMDRNLTTHCYNEKHARQLQRKIKSSYFPILEKLYLTEKNDQKKV